MDIKSWDSVKPRRATYMIRQQYGYEPYQSVCDPPLLLVDAYQHSHCLPHTH